MIWTLITIVLIVVGILMCLFCEKHTFKHYTLGDFLSIISIISSGLGVILLIALLIVFSCENITYKFNTERSNIEYQGLIKRLECINSDYEDVSKSDVIKDITEWNKEVYAEKHWSESKWTNWLYCKKYADSLNYIELESEEK